MSFESEYRQVLLFRGPERQVCWIPACFANVGCVLKLKENDEWQDGWIVSQLYGSEDSKRLESNEATRRRMKRTSSICRE